jgi:hypothetical protein
VLPIGEDSWDYGETLFAGADMTERREILGRISSIYVLIEGGPRTEHEVDVALAHQAFVIPVARCGGFASALYERMERPRVMTEGTWELLGSKIASIDATANAVFQAVTSCLEALDVPKV